MFPGIVGRGQLASKSLQNKYDPLETHRKVQYKEGNKRNEVREGVSLQNASHHHHLQSYPLVCQTGSERVRQREKFAVVRRSGETGPWGI